MILVKGKYPDIHPFAFKSQGPAGQEIPWSHLQILGGRQLVAFDKDGDVIGTVDLALTSELKIIRTADIIGYTAEGANVTVLSRKVTEAPTTPMETVALLRKQIAERQTAEQAAPTQLQSGDDYDYDEDFDDDQYEY
jgi:hypothetical protein